MSKSVLRVLAGASLGMVSVLVVGEAEASIQSSTSFGGVSNGDVIDNDFAGGPTGFVVSGTPGDVVAYDVNDPNNGDTDDISPAGQSVGLDIVLIAQEAGNDADNGTECQCIPDDSPTGSITLDFASPVVSFRQHCSTSRSRRPTSSLSTRPRGQRRS